MNNQISFGEDTDKITLQCDGQTIYSSRPPVSIGERLFWFLVLLPLLAIDIFLLFLICFLLPKAMIEEKSFLCLLLFVVFSLGLIPMLGVTYYAQSFIFRFSAVYNLSTGKYKLKSGMLRITRSYDPQSTVIMIHLSYLRGDWGYGAKIQAKKRWRSLPFIPTGCIGSKAETYREAIEIRDWLHERNVSSEMKP